MEAAYRTAYRWFVGPLVPGMHIDHLCSVRACVNPEHLEQVTPEENIRRAHPPKDFCPHGHPLAGPNLYLYTWPKTGWTQRMCRTCISERMKRWRAKQ